MRNLNAARFRAYLATGLQTGQRLKPNSSAALYGTAEAVPYKYSGGATHALQVGQVVYDKDNHTAMNFRRLKIFLVRMPILCRARLQPCRYKLKINAALAAGLFGVSCLKRF
jgi:hypothetical protein